MTKNIILWVVKGISTWDELNNRLSSILKGCRE